MDATSTFQFVGHKVVKLLVQVPIGYNQNEKPNSINYYASYDVEYQTDRWVGSVTIGFHQKSREGDDSDVLFEVIVTGRFVYPSNNTEEAKNEVVNFLKTSGAATVVPLARAAVASAGALCGSQNVCIVPNINVYQLNWALPNQQ